jgi:hypothetical protein
MNHADDLRLNEPDPSFQPRFPGPSDDRPPVWPWLAGLAVIVAIGVASWYLWWPTPKPPATSTEVAVAPTSPPETGTGLGPSVPAIDLPALDLTDPIVRDLMRRLSSRPEAMAWLATDGLIRNFAVCVQSVAEGNSPAAQLKQLAPNDRFRVTKKGTRVIADARSFARYDGIADTVAALDSNGLARLYSTLKPRLEDAYKELGHPEGGIDAAVEAAIVHLLGTPVVEGDAGLSPRTLSYHYADQRLEAVSAAQKQLLRMGPRNQPLVQKALHDIARALGIAEKRLPAPHALQ